MRKSIFYILVGMVAGAMVASMLTMARRGQARHDPASLISRRGLSEPRHNAAELVPASPGGEQGRHTIVRQEEEPKVPVPSREGTSPEVTAGVEASKNVTISEKRLVEKLAQFEEFPSGFNARLLNIESIFALQENRGCLIRPNPLSDPFNPPGTATITDSNGRGVYFQPELFPERKALRGHPDGEKVQEDLYATVVMRAHEALATFGPSGVAEEVSKSKE
jgi:hypothetical protein